MGLFQMAAEGGRGEISLPLLGKLEKASLTFRSPSHC